MCKAHPVQTIYAVLAIIILDRQQTIKDNYFACASLKMAKLLIKSRAIFFTRKQFDKNPLSHLKTMIWII